MRARASPAHAVPPSAHTSTDCLEVRLAGGWNDESCSSQRNYVIEYSPGARFSVGHVLFSRAPAHLLKAGTEKLKKKARGNI